MNNLIEQVIYLWVYYNNMIPEIDKNGLAHGELVMVYDDGQIEEHLYFENNIERGEQLYYDKIYLHKLNNPTI